MTFIVNILGFVWSAVMGILAICFPFILLYFMYDSWKHSAKQGEN